MNLFVINNENILDILNSLSVNDNIKEIVKTIAISGSYSYINFVHELFSIYAINYCSIIDEKSYLTKEDIDTIHNIFLEHNIVPNLSNVLVSDIYDIMSLLRVSDDSVLNSFFNEYLFKSLESLYGEIKALDYINSVYDAIESIFGLIESHIVSKLILDDEKCGIVVVYPEIVNNRLMFYVFSYSG